MIISFVVSDGFCVEIIGNPQDAGGAFRKIELKDCTAFRCKCPGKLLRQPWPIGRVERDIVDGCYEVGEIFFFHNHHSPRARRTSAGKSPVRRSTFDTTYGDALLPCW